MNKYERRIWFERLLQLRSAYLAQTHSGIGMSVEQAIAHGERLLAEPEAFAEALGRDASPVPGATTNPAA